MDVCVILFCDCVVLCVGSGLATGWSPSEESYRLCIGLRTEKVARARQRTVEPLMMMNRMFNEYGTVLEMRICRETEIVRENLPKCHFIHQKSCVIWDWTWTAAVESRRITARATARSKHVETVCTPIRTALPYLECYSNYCIPSSPTLSASVNVCF
jgi:hypothetical protein